MATQREQAVTRDHLIERNEEKCTSPPEMTQGLSPQSSSTTQAPSELEYRQSTPETSHELLTSSVSGEHRIVEAQCNIEVAPKTFPDVPDGSASGHTTIDDDKNDPNDQVTTTSVETSNGSGFTRLHKLSTMTTTTFILACFAVPCSAAFLGFLWSNPDGTHANSTWLNIVLSGWTLRSVTISTLVLRAAVTTQAAIATAMLACIIVETRGVPLPALAAVNHLRFVNNGPQSLVFGLRGAYSNSGRWACVTLLLYTTTLCLQFTSTVLVADLGIGPLAGPSRSNATSVAMSFQNADLTAERFSGQTPYFKNDPQSFPTFAEYHESPLTTESQPDNMIRDTGITYRAFIPLAAESTRTSVQQFSGVATVLDARVVCVRPKVHSGLSVGYMSEDVGWILNGSLTPELAPPGLILSEEPAMTSGLEEMGFALGANNTNDSFITLSWGQQVPFAHDEGWAVAQKYMYFGPALVSSLDPRYPDIAARSIEPTNFTMQNPDYLAWNLTYYQEGDDIPLMTGRSYQLLNITAAQDVPAIINKTDSGDPINFYFSLDQDLNRLVITPQDEWLVFTIPRLVNWQISVSLCFDSFFSIDANVSYMTDNSSNSEPSLGVWNVSSQSFDTEAVRRQLGGTLSSNLTSLSERGVFSLETTPQQLRDQVQVWYNQSKSDGWTNISFPTQNFIQPDLKSIYSWGTWMCPTCGMAFANKSNENITYQGNNNIQNQIFQDVIKTTGNSALAWQTYFSTLGRLIYYEHLQYFDVPDTPMVAWYQSVQFPRAQRGLIAAMIVLCVHVGLVGLVTTVFFWKTRVSRIGDNAWQSIAQFVNSADLVGTFIASETLKDGDVRKEIIKNRLEKEVIHIGKSDSVLRG